MYVTIIDEKDWLVEYNPETEKYRVSYFEDYHYWDEIEFSVNKYKEVTYGD